MWPWTRFRRLTELLTEMTRQRDDAVFKAIKLRHRLRDLELQRERLDALFQRSETDLVVAREELRLLRSKEEVRRAPTLHGSVFKDDPFTEDTKLPDEFFTPPVDETLDVDAVERAIDEPAVTA